MRSGSSWSIFPSLPLCATECCATAVGLHRRARRSAPVRSGLQCSESCLEALELPELEQASGARTSGSIEGQREAFIERHIAAQSHQSLTLLDLFGVLG